VRRWWGNITAYAAGKPNTTSTKYTSDRLSNRVNILGIRMFAVENRMLKIIARAESIESHLFLIDSTCVGGGVEVTQKNEAVLTLSA
jgi:hypothetical protein